MNINNFSEEEFLPSYITDQPQNPTICNTSKGKSNILTSEDPKKGIHKTGRSQGRKKIYLKNWQIHQLKDRLKKKYKFKKKL